MPRKISLEEVEKRLPSFLRIMPETYKGVRYYATFIDIDYDEKFDALVDSVIRLQHGCKSRSNFLRSETNKLKFTRKGGANKIKLEEVISKLPSFLKMDEESYQGVRNKCRFYDKDYDVWFESTPANMIKGKGFCKERWLDNNKVKNIIPLTEIQERIYKLYGNSIKIIPETYIDTNKSASFQREDGTIFKSSPWNIISGRYGLRKNLEKWKYTVLVRDNWKCVKCESDENLSAHHIKSFSKFPDERLNVDNGATLCLKCHNLYHALYRNIESIENFEEFIKSNG